MKSIDYPVSRIQMLLAVLLIAIPFATASADSYPELFLRGSQTADWSPVESRRMHRDGNVYSIHVSGLQGEFKISDPDWNVEYGSPASGKTDLTRSTLIRGVRRGPNFIISSPADVEISLTYDPARPDLSILTVIIDGGKPLPFGASGTLPLLYINVYDDYTGNGSHGAMSDEIIDKDLPHKNYFNGNYYLDLNGCDFMDGAGSTGSAAEPLDLQIKARGNFSRTAFSKKPFKLKLDKKQALLGLSKSKHFAILAHADDDKGYLRNYVGFNLGNRIGLPWTPSQQPVEVVINGDYRGLYFLTESIRVGDGRVPVEELDDLESDPALASGGYIVELDNYDEDDAHQIRLDEKGQAPGHKDKLRITFDTPEEYSPIQRRFILDQFTAINDAVGDNSDTLWSYLDIDDAARYYIVEEIISHTEAYHGSTYLFRDRGEGKKWHFSPLWDCGNAFNGPADDFFYRRPLFSCTWIPSMRLNETFNRKVSETWLWFMSQKFEGLYSDIDSYTASIAEAAKADRLRWKDAPQPSGQSRPVSDNSDMSRRRDEVTSHLKAKTDWLKAEFGDFTGGSYPEPERDSSPAAPLPSYMTESSVGALPDEDDAPARYFDILGLPVENPEPGNLYIRTRGRTVDKIIFR